MSLPKRLIRNRQLRLYLLGQLAILGGAAAMEAWHSMVPMALAGSLAIMLTVPLVRQQATARARRR